MKAHLTKRLVCLILAIVLCLSAAVIPALAANDTKNVKVKVQKVSNDTVPTELNPERQAAAEDTVQTQSAEGPVRVSIVVKVDPFWINIQRTALPPTTLPPITGSRCALRRTRWRVKSPQTYSAARSWTWCGI